MQLRSHLAKTADTAWAAYASTVRTGGTPDQRRWAFDRANRAEDALAQHDRIVDAKRDTQEIEAVA